MAGAGYKLFNTGDVLTAAQVNTYLQEQTVMVFASSAARTSALSGVLAEGMVSYLQDTNAVEVYNGTAWVGVSGAGDLTEIVAGTGITVTSGTGPIPTVALTTPVAATNGGTAQTTYTTGDLLYASGTNTLAKRAIGSTGNVLTVSGGIPTWAAPSGDWVKITEIVNSSTATFSFTSIPSTYRNLIIIGMGRSGLSTSTNGQGLMRFNGDTSSIYDTEMLPDGIDAAGTVVLASSYARPFATISSTSTANNAGAWTIFIPNYKGTTFNKAWFGTQSCWFGTTDATSVRTNIFNGIWRSTSAITSIELSDASGGGGFLSGSVCTLYGVM